MVLTQLTLLSFFYLISVYSYSNNYPPVSSKNSHLERTTIHEKQIESFEDMKSEPVYTETSEPHPKTDKLLENEIFIPSSPTLNTFANVTYWAETEETIFTLIKSHRKKVKEDVGNVKRFIERYKATSASVATCSSRPSTLKNVKIGLFVSKATSNSGSDRFHHVLQLLKEITEFTHVSINLLDILFQKSPQTHKKVVSESSSRNFGSVVPSWPNFNDLEYAMYSLIHIKEAFNFEFKDLPNELSPETRKPPDLNAFHCTEIGKLALYIEHYAAAIEWMEHCLQKITLDQDSSTTRPILKSNLKFAIELHNWNLEATRNSKSLFVDNLFHDLVTLSPHPIDKRKRLSTPQPKGEDDLKNAKLAALSKFNTICSSTGERAMQNRHSLYCWYDTSSSPARAIQPYKKELISFEPEVIQVYEFLGDQQITKLLKSKAHCSWTIHTLAVKSYSQMTSSRTSSICWLDDPESEDIKKKVSSLTLADFRENGSCGPVNLNNYLFGRFHTVHLDALQVNTDKLKNSPLLDQLQTLGDRFITLLFYFNDVGSGGLTVFPENGATASPVKGSVLVWKNLYRNGTARMDMWHGGCPVIYGHKLGGILQVHYNSQFLTYPCTLNPNE